MTDFTVAQQAEAAIAAPSVPSPGAAGANPGGAAAAAVVSGLGDLATIFAARNARTAPSLSALNKGQENTLVGAYLEQQQKLAEVLRQSPSRRPEIEARGRALASQFMASNPTHSQAIADAHKKFVEPSGLGPLIQSRTKRERVLEARREKYLTDGRINPTLSQAAQDEQFRKAAATDDLRCGRERFA